MFLHVPETARTIVMGRFTLHKLTLNIKRKRCPRLEDTCLHKQCLKLSTRLYKKAATLRSIAANRCTVLLARKSGFASTKRNFKRMDTQKMSLFSPWTLPKEVWCKFSTLVNEVNLSHLKIPVLVDGFMLRCSRASSVPSWPIGIRHDRIKQLTVSPPGANVIPALQLRLLTRLVGKEVLVFHWFVLPTKEETQPQ